MTHLIWTDQKSTQASPNSSSFQNPRGNKQPAILAQPAYYSFNDGSEIPVKQCIEAAQYARARTSINVGSESPQTHSDRERTSNNPENNERKASNARAHHQLPSFLTTLVRVCRYFPDCKYGNTCKYAHDIRRLPPPQPLPFTSPVELCRYFPPCKYGNACRYAHDIRRLGFAAPLIRPNIEGRAVVSHVVPPSTRRHIPCCPDPLDFDLAQELMEPVEGREW